MQVSLYLRVTSRSQQNSWELSGQPKLTEILQRECRFGNFLQDIFKNLGIPREALEIFPFRQRPSHSPMENNFPKILVECVSVDCTCTPGWKTPLGVQKCREELKTGSWEKKQI